MESEVFYQNESELTDSEIHDCFQQKSKDKAAERRRIAEAILNKYKEKIMAAIEDDRQSAALSRAMEPLTDEKLLSMWSGGDERFMRPVLGKNKVLAFARAIERAHGITAITPKD